MTVKERKTYENDETKLLALGKRFYGTLMHNKYSPKTLMLFLKTIGRKMYFMFEYKILLILFYFLLFLVT